VLADWAGTEASEVAVLLRRLEVDSLQTVDDRGAISRADGCSNERLT
jgi:hypothetical protein